MYPCQAGLKCPHYGISEEYDQICIAPYTPDNCPEDDTFPIIDNTILDCPMRDEDSDLNWILTAYETSPSVRLAVKKEKERLEKEAEGLIQQMRERQRAREEERRGEDVH